MAVFARPKLAKFNELTLHRKLYQEFPTRTQQFTRQSLVRWIIRLNRRRVLKLLGMFIVG
jgi:hypothetical protein